MGFIRLIYAHRKTSLRDADDVLHQEQMSHCDNNSAYESIPTPLSIHWILCAHACPKMTLYLTVSMSFMLLLVPMLFAAAANTFVVHPS